MRGLTAFSGAEKQGEATGEGGWKWRNALALRANRRSFDCASRDKTARGSAQDDNFSTHP